MRKRESILYVYKISNHTVYFSINFNPKRKKEWCRGVPCTILHPLRCFFQLQEWWAVGHFNLKHCNGWQVRIIVALHIHLLRTAPLDTKLNLELPFQKCFYPLAAFHEGSKFWTHEMTENQWWVKSEMLQATSNHSVILRSK